MSAEDDAKDAALMLWSLKRIEEIARALVQVHETAYAELKKAIREHEQAWPPER